MPAITYEELVQVCEYDAELGAFRWKKDMGPHGRIKAGTLVATRMADGGRYMSVNHKAGRVSTLVWMFHRGEGPGEKLIPRDGDYENDRIENLCLASQAKSEGIGHHGFRSTREMTADVVRDLFDYDAGSGQLIWRKKAAQSVRVGRVAGSAGNHGHWSISLGGRDYLRSRLVWLHQRGDAPRSKLAHLNGDKQDDRIENLAESAFTHGDFDLRTKEGRNRYTREHRQKHKAMYRDKQLKASFGISQSDYERMLAAQEGVCAICERPETMVRWGKSTPLAVDHDHDTGEIRGLLCSACNQGIGRFDDDESRLLAAVAYLRKSRGFVPAKPEPRSAYAGYA